MKINLPGVHGGISQQSPNLRLMNQHENAANVLFDVLYGIRGPRWGTTSLGTTAGAMLGVVGNIKTTDGKLWIVSWDGTKFRFVDTTDKDTVVLDKTVTPPSGYLTGVTASDLVAMDILDTMVILNKKKTVARSVTSDYRLGLPWAYVYIPQVFEGLSYSVTVKVVSTKVVGATPVGTQLYTATGTAVVAAGEYSADIIGDLLTSLITDPTYVTATASTTDSLRLVLTAAALPYEPEIQVTSDSQFDVRTYSLTPALKDSTTGALGWVTTTPSYESLPPIVGQSVVFKISDGYYARFNGVSYVECAAPGHGYRLDKTTMPHQLTYSISTGLWTWAALDAYDTNGRQVGDAVSAPMPNFVDRQLNNVFFHRNRLCFMSDNYVALSSVGEYYNWFPATAVEVTDSDPIVVFPTSTRFSELRWAVPFSKQLVLLSNTKQYVLHSGYDALTPQTVAIDEATNYKLLPDVPPLSLEASLVLPLDHGDFTGFLEYKLDDQQIASEGSLLTSTVPQLIPSGITDVCYMPAEHMVLAYQRANGDPAVDSRTVYVYKFNKREDGQLTQMAWSKWLMPANVNYILPYEGTKLFFIMADDECLFMDTSATLGSVVMDFMRERTISNGHVFTEFNEYRAVDKVTLKEYTVDPDTRALVVDSATPVTVITGVAIEWHTTLSPLLMRDDNGLPRADLKLTLENMTIDWVGGAFDVVLSGQGLVSRVKSVTPDTYGLTLVAPGTSLTDPHPTRVLLMAPAKRAVVTLQGDGYLTTQINNISFNADVSRDWG